jgi:hypothetical protein
LQLFSVASTLARRICEEATMAVRTIQETERAQAAALLGESRSLDSKRVRALVHEQGPAAGLALWVEPAGGGEPLLGAVITPAGAGATFYELALACAEDALARGHRSASFRVKDALLLHEVQRTFHVEPVASGWTPRTGEPSEWDIRVDLPDAIGQLRAVLRRAG